MTEKQERERAMFEAFLQTAPEFTGESIAKWWQLEDEKQFRDIEATSTSGKSVGVELGEWLNQGEMQAAKTKSGWKNAALDDFRSWLIREAA